MVQMQISPAIVTTKVGMDSGRRKMSNASRERIGERHGREEVPVVTNLRSARRTGAM